MRAMLKSLLPSIVHDLRHGGRRYPSWEAACKASPSYMYEDEKRIAFRVASAALHPVDGKLLASSALPLIVMALKPDLVVTDFGGSTGNLGLDFLAAFPRATYIVVETTRRT
jgi:hypothetical protein